jgi:hypothetical protein
MRLALRNGSGLHCNGIERIADMLSSALMIARPITCRNGGAHGACEAVKKANRRPIITR